MGNEVSQPLIHHQHIQAPVCDAECERQKRIIELKSNYETAIRDETKDTDEVRLARKQYYTYTFGEGAYDNLEAKALSKVADSNISKLKKKFNDITAEIKEEKKNNKSFRIALKNMDELLKKYQGSNNKIAGSLDNQEDILETSRRNVWYTNQRISKMEYYGYFLNLVVRILLFISVIFFLYDKKYVSLGVVILFAILISRLT